MTEWMTVPGEAQVVHELHAAFTDRWDGAADGVWAAPGRVNLLGEHTDYNDGLCLPMALPHRTYAAVRLRSDDTVRVASRQQEQVWDGTVAEVGPGSPPGWAGYAAGVLGALRDTGVDLPGLDVLVDGYVPLGAGLSSSAALSCSVAVALADLVPDVGALDRAQLTSVCVAAENVVVGAATGGMDQTASLRAREGHVLVLDCADFSIEHVPWGLSEHEVLVVDTRASHSLGDGQYEQRRRTCEAAAGALALPSLRAVTDLDAALGRLEDDEQRRRVRHVVTEIQRVRQAVPALRSGDAVAFGRLMDASHASMRDDYEISCRELDLAVEAAGSAGAVGARMTGGGFGGSALALVRRGSAADVAGQVTAAFADAGLRAPRCAVVHPSAPAAAVTGSGRVAS